MDQEGKKLEREMKARLKILNSYDKKIWIRIHKEFDNFNQKSLSAHDIIIIGIIKYGKEDILYMMEETGEFSEIGYNEKELRKAIKIMNREIDNFSEEDFLNPWEF